MLVRLLIGICLALLACGCQPPCTPGLVAPMSNTVQRYHPNPRLIDFNIEIGDCEPGHVPIPKARVIGPTGQVGSAVVEIDQREAQLRAGKWPRLAVGTIEIHPLEPGSSTIELEFQTVTRRVNVALVEVLNPERSPRLPVFCRPPLRLEGGVAVCTTTDFDGVTSRVIELRDGGVTSLGPGSRLWATPVGHFVSVDGGLGRLRPGEALGGWQPEAALQGSALGVSATEDSVVVLQRDSIEIRSSADLSIMVRVPTRHEASGSPQLVASTSSAIFTSGYVRRSLEDGGVADVVSTETFEVSDAGIISLGVVEGGRENPIAARGDRYWTSDGERLRVYAVANGPLSGALFDVGKIGSCGGFGDKPGCWAGGILGPFGIEGAFLQCPFVDDGGVRFVSIGLAADEIGDCEGNYAYVGDIGWPGGPDTDGYLDVIDLSPYVATAPYR